jgi:RES domain-containing protein
MSDVRGAYRGTLFRAHNPRWAYAPTSGDGAKRHGSRFNPRGRAALYLSERIETAWLEAQQGFAFKAQPMTLCAYHVDCTDVLDLTDSSVLDALAISPSDLGCAWELIAASGDRPVTWALAERLMAQGTAAVRVPSFAPGSKAADINVVFWTWRDEPPHMVRVIDDHGRLPADDRSWQ